VVALLVGALPGLAFAASAAPDMPRVMPRPKVERYGASWAPLTEASQTLLVGMPNAEGECPTAVREGLALLSRRLKALGAGAAGAEQAEAGDPCHVVVELCSEERLSEVLHTKGAEETLKAKRLQQAYVLECAPPQDGHPVVSIQSCNGLGAYYGLVSLCQLLAQDEAGGVRVAEAAILDWPAIGLRLSKTSATHNRLATIETYAAWLPLCKMNLMGLQFHGEESKDLGRFKGNVEAMCSQAREVGVLETVVYFCPFRGEGYDFRQPTDRQAYVDLIHWVFDQGAHGIEVDYNDWPGQDTQIEDVINLACQAVGQKRPGAYVLYCPPNRGSSQYRGEATPEMHRILSQVPPYVWPLWTGMATLITQPLEPAQVEQWTENAGRRPFLWVNRVSLGVRKAFSRPVHEGAETHVFQGELLPRDLDRLFEGIHFNAGFSRDYNTLPVRFQSASVAYFATAADYVWNPHAWDAAESCQRAGRFVEIMQPLLEE